MKNLPLNWFLLFLEMTLCMLCKMIRAQEATSARSTLEFLFSSMSSPMARKLIRTRKFSSTIFPSASKWFLSCIIHKTLKIHIRQYYHARRNTYKLSIQLQNCLLHTCMSSLMSFEMRRLVVRFSTALPKTTVRATSFSVVIHGCRLFSSTNSGNSRSIIIVGSGHNGWSIVENERHSGSQLLLRVHNCC